MELVPTNNEEAGSATDAQKRLQRLIQRKKSEKRRLIEESEQCSIRLAALRGLERERLEPLNTEILAQFKRVLSDRRFGGSHEEILGLLEELMDCGLLSPPSSELTEPCDCPSCRAAGEHESNPGAEPNDGGRYSSKSNQRRGDDANQVDCASATRVEGSGLRDLYRGLATRFHPDKARSEDERLENEERMREINQAYAEGNLTTLAALSAEVGYQISGHGVLEALAAEYSRIKTTIRELRREPLGELVVELRRCRRERIKNPLDAIADEIEAEAGLLESLALIFRRQEKGKITPDEFLVELLIDDKPETFDDVTFAVGSLFEPTISASRPSSKTRKAARKKKAKRKQAKRTKHR